MAERVIQRTVFPADRQMLSLYCRFGEPPAVSPREPEFLDRFSVRIGRGARLSTDAYFNTLFECHWRQYARPEGLRLRLTVSGSGTVRLVRRNSLSGLAVVAATNFAGESANIVLEVPPLRLHSREAGLVHFEVAARSEEVLLHKAEWVAVGSAGADVKLVVGYCTFNRERHMLRNVGDVLDDPRVAASVGLVVVVDQGSRKIRHYPGFAAAAARAGAKLRVMEQGNFGGAGGFTRAILEAGEVAGATHVLLMDDDAIVEPESIFRAAAFLALAGEEIALGAPMLDMLRPLELYEAGGRLEPSRLRAGSPVRRLSVHTPESLESLREVAYSHYNAWCFFAFSLRALCRIGLPLPLFIRGDDAEFGLRLLGAGIPTVTLPGLGVWHEPFYLKEGGWQPYYDLRNMLVLAAVHAPQPGWRTALVFFQKLGLRLLTLDYAQATLLCEAADDYCRGPRVVEVDPGAVHRKVEALLRGRVQERVARVQPLPAARAIVRAGGVWRLLRCVLRQFLRASPPATAQPTTVLPLDCQRWQTLGLGDVVAIDGWEPDHYLVRRRCRRSFLRLLARGGRVACRLWRANRRVAAEWRDAFPRLTGEEFWRGHLGLAKTAPEGGDRDAPRREAA